MDHCKHKIMHGILRFEWCKRPAVKDGYCTRHHWTYVSPRDRKAEAEWEAQLVAKEMKANT